MTMTAVCKDHLDVLMRTIYGEARGEPFEGKLAVAHVVLNRVSTAEAWWGRDIEEVCHKPWQFSCWNESDPNFGKLKAATLDDADMRDCLAAAASAIWGLLDDPTDGCCHYMTSARREKGWPRSWGDPQEPHREIGTHLFYKGIR